MKNRKTGFVLGYFILVTVQTVAIAVLAGLATFGLMLVDKKDMAEAMGMTVNDAELIHTMLLGASIGLVIILRKYSYNFLAPA